MKLKSYASKNSALLCLLVLNILTPFLAHAEEPTCAEIFEKIRTAQIIPFTNSKKMEPPKVKTVDELMQEEDDVHISPARRAIEEEAINRFRESSTDIEFEEAMSHIYFLIDEYHKNSELVQLDETTRYRRISALLRADPIFDNLYYKKMSLFFAFTSRLAHNRSESTEQMIAIFSKKYLLKGDSQKALIAQEIDKIRDERIPENVKQARIKELLSEIVEVKITGAQLVADVVTDLLIKDLITDLIDGDYLGLSTTEIIADSLAVYKARIAAQTKSITRSDSSSVIQTANIFANPEYQKKLNNVYARIDKYRNPIPRLADASTDHNIYVRRLRIDYLLSADKRFTKLERAQKDRLIDELLSPVNFLPAVIPENAKLIINQFFRNGR